MQKPKKDEAVNCPTAWFAVLERAKRTGNADLENRALRELNRLGVKVEFSHHPRPGLIGGTHD